AGVWMAEHPAMSWRIVFLSGLLPAAAAFMVRLFLEEPERWRQAVRDAAPVRLAEIFAPDLRHITFAGVCMSVVALIAWWSCNAFIPTVATGLAQTAAASSGFDASATLTLVENWKFRATSWFNLGGLFGTLLTIPIAKLLGRRALYGIYFTASALAIFVTFGFDWPPGVRLYWYFAIGASVFGVFGSFTYYLPELFPTRLRATGAGFCYNIGRVLAAAGPFAVGTIAARGADTVMHTLLYVGLVPALGLLLLPWVVETRDRVLTD
ncbi:MAG TPA: hypothetical protein PKC08_01820, partial [Pseudomonadales bacterium]|nr:hypothetical protein [Pseudomonadales bacterium]